MDSDAAPLIPSRARRILGASFGYVVGIVCLIWVFHGVDLREFLRRVTDVEWGWVALAVALDILTYLCQGFRWVLLLKPVGELPAIRATQAIYVGLFTNEVLPMRLGEVVRTYLVSRWISKPFATVIPSLVVERFLDGVWLAIGVGLTMILVPLPKELMQAGDTLGAVILLATVLFFSVALSKDKPGGAPAGFLRRSKPIHRIVEFARRLRKGVRDIGVSGRFYGAFGLSCLLLVSEALAFWLIMWACGLRLSAWVGAAVFLIVRLGTAVPNAPANVGSYQFFTVIGLALFGVEKTVATSFSVVVFILLTIPLWVIGFFALSRTGTTLRNIRREINQLLAQSN